MKHVMLVLLLLGMAPMSASAAAANCDDDSRYTEVSKQELKSLIEKKSVFVVDVNGEETFEEKHIPGAVHYGSNRKNFAKVLPSSKDSLIVAYCGGPKCTAWKRAAKEACKLGYENVRHYKGGLKGWFENS